MTYYSSQKVRSTQPRWAIWLVLLIAFWLIPLHLLQTGTPLPGKLFAQEANQQPDANNANEANPENAAPENANGDGAEDAGEEEPAEEPPATIMELIIDSGITGWLFLGVLLLFSFVGGMVAIKQSLQIRRKVILPEPFVRELEQTLDKDTTDKQTLVELCDRWKAPLANIFAAGLLRTGRPVPEVEKSMEDAAAREMAELRGGVRPLNVVGSISPLVGLLGTVVGMIMAFRTASEGGLGGDGQQLAQGIYMALLTTAAGLTIAIPSLLMATWLNSKLERFFRELDRHLMETIPFFARAEFQAAAPMAPAATPAESASEPAATQEPALSPS